MGIVDDKEPMIVSIVVRDMAQLAAVYALLGGVSGNALMSAAPAKLQSAPVASVSDGGAPSASPSQSIEAIPSAPTSSNSDDLDAHGHSWSAELHASTKAKTGADLWRMKPGATRPAPMPGFPKDTGTASKPTATASATTVDDDDEFAAFAAAAGNPVPAAAKARKWTDADMSKLCNQAATKLGDPAPIKEVIADFVPEGSVPHSRNIAEEDREAFAQALEARAGIEFAG